MIRDLLTRLGLRDPNRLPLIDRVLSALIPRLPAWVLPGVAFVLAVGGLLIAWDALT